MSNEVETVVFDSPLNVSLQGGMVEGRPVLAVNFLRPSSGALVKQLVFKAPLPPPQATAEVPPPAEQTDEQE